MNYLYLLFGLILLILGAEALVRGASKLAAALGISPLIIGLTVVAFGTSAPELAVSLKSAFAGQPNIALGNAVGSNIFNVLFILGLSALFAPLIVSQQLVRIDVPLMIAASVLVLILGGDGNLSQIDGGILCLGLIAYMVFLIVLSRKESTAIKNEYEAAFGAKKEREQKNHYINILWVIAGLGLLVLGSSWLVNSAVAIAKNLGVSDLIIGLTIIAAGTSMPELVTSVVASLKGERDIAVGNVVGSNLFNLLGVLGFTSLISPLGIDISPAALRFDIPVMIAVAAACLPIFFTGNLIARWEGILFLFYYVLYTLFLILDTTGHEALPKLGNALYYFVIPLTLFSLIVLALREWRNRKQLGVRPLE